MKQKPICIIPARGDSKRIKNKNIKFFFGKPLIGHAIKLAKKTKIFSRVIVSTDSSKIAKVAKKFGAEVPFLRDQKLSNDKVNVPEVLFDCIKRISTEKISEHFCIYPTSPLLRKKDIIEAYKKFKRKKADGLVAVSDYDFPPVRAFKVINGERIKYKWPKFSSKRSQDLERLLHDTGTFYIFKTRFFLKTKTIFGNNTCYYFMDRLNSIDIDNPEDFEIAKIFYKHRKLKK
tara:strand:+ start:9580 stop:10275 length:696 start_codon:yes stop_codon:yes gene_type:complete